MLSFNLPDPGNDDSSDEETLPLFAPDSERDRIIYNRMQRRVNEITGNFVIASTFTMFFASLAPLNHTSAEYSPFDTTTIDSVIRDSLAFATGTGSSILTSLWANPRRFFSRPDRYLSLQISASLTTILLSDTISALWEIDPSSAIVISAAYVSGLGVGCNLASRLATRLAPRLIAAFEYCHENSSPRLG